MEENKFNITVPEGAEKVEIIIREVDTVNEIQLKEPQNLNLRGTINSVVEFLKKRKETDKFNPFCSHVKVSRETLSVLLVTNETDYYAKETVLGEMRIHPKFTEFGVNTGKVWTPTELGQFCKMNRSFFTDRQVNQKIVSELMNFTATVNNHLTKVVKESGDRTDNFEQVVNSNLPKSFMLNVPLFRGAKPISIEVETFSKISGRDVSFVLFSPDAQAYIEDERNTIIDKVIAEIAEISPELLIIEE